MSFFRCTKCQALCDRWRSFCPRCGEWNTYRVKKDKTRTSRKKSILLDSGTQAPVKRFETGVEPLDLVLGGGIVTDSLVFLSGPPGIGKSTLILEIIRGFTQAQPSHAILYATGEESEAQVQDRALRLEVEGGSQVFVLSETELQAIFNEALEKKAKLLIIDSIQTMHSLTHESAPGNPYQLKEVSGQLLTFCKQNKVACLLIGHVDKEGDTAGPRVIEHLVDAVITLDLMAPSSPFRILRASKNRFGSTLVQGVLEMTEKGLKKAEIL